MGRLRRLGALTFRTGLLPGPAQARAAVCLGRT